MARATRAVAEAQTLLFKADRTPKQAFRYVRDYLAGQFVGATRDDALLAEVLKCLFCKLSVETGAEKPFDLAGDAFDLAKSVRGVFKRVKSRFPEIYSSDAEILLDPEALRVVMNALDFSLMDAESDPIGDAFEVFVGSESRGAAGQFFTPRSVTAMLVAALDPKLGETVLDPACGAGGFLASVCAHLQRSGATSGEIADNAARHLFGIDKDSYLAQLAAVHLALLTGSHPSILCGDSIALTQGKLDLRDGLPKGGVDVLLTNPPFGVRIVAANDNVMSQFALARKWIVDRQSGRLEPSNSFQGNVPPQVLFVERCLSLLKPGGRLGMVLPESVLSNKSYRHVVEYLMRHAHLQGVIGMPEALFKTSGKGGTHTKTCLLIAEKTGKKNGKRSSKIFMAEAKWCGQDSRARTIPNNDLPVISANLLGFQRGKPATPSTLGFTLETGDVAGGVLCPRYYDPRAGEELLTLESSHHLLRFGQLVSDGVLSLSTGDEIGKLAYGTGDIPFIRTSDISNWEIKSDPKHGVSSEIYDGLASKQNVRPLDVLMVKDGTYLIGTCAIVSEADQRILFQSHLYKIRVNENQHDLNPYLLLAALSSPVVQRQIRSKQFTQDIIDSLGERINELVIPIPKSKKRREHVTELVRSAVAKRVEARDLAKEARSLVTS